MTIYKPKNGGEKKLGKKLDKPVAIFTTDDFAPLTRSEWSDAGGECVGSSRGLNPGSFARETWIVEKRLPRFFALVVILSICILTAFFGFFIHRHMTNYKASKPIIGTIHVKFHEYLPAEYESDPVETRMDGAFYEQVEIDASDSGYERLNIPPFYNSKNSVVLHDFRYNVTAVIDRDEMHCFILPLNRSIINTPIRFSEKLSELKFGSSLQSARIERQKYVVMTPPLDSIAPLGDTAGSECKYYKTYRLAKHDEPIAMSKRFACEFSGLTFSLGETGYPLMLMITLDSCI